MSHDCLFCKIARGEIPAEVVYEDADMMAFHDIAPKADTHLLLIPKKHIASLDDVAAEDADLMAAMMRTLPELAKAQGLDSGFRTIINTGKGGGQVVFHLHIHVLGGRNLPGFE
jgi:histidine triad (HIT) family protein